MKPQQKHTTAKQQSKPMHRVVATVNDSDEEDFTTSNCQYTKGIQIRIINIYTF